jgi:hypothetical protein
MLGTRTHRDVEHSTGGMDSRSVPDPARNYYEATIGNSGCLDPFGPIEEEFGVTF